MRVGAQLSPEFCVLHRSLNVHNSIGNLTRSFVIVVRD